MGALSVPAPVWIHDRFQDQDEFMIGSSTGLGS